MAAYRARATLLHHMDVLNKAVYRHPGFYLEILNIPISPYESGLKLM